MQALVLHGVGDLRLEQIQCRNFLKAKCASESVSVGSVVPIFRESLSKAPIVFQPSVGTNSQVLCETCGPGVEDFAPGDPVVVFPLLWCGRCPACEQGKYVQCHDYDYLGSRSDGAFAECVVAPKANLIPVPHGVTLEEASMTEPAAVALHALRRVGTSLAGKVVAIFGAGPIGLMVAQWARIMGAAEVLLFDIIPEKLELAQQLGFDKVFNSTTDEQLRL